MFRSQMDSADGCGRTHRARPGVRDGVFRELHRNVLPRISSHTFWYYGESFSLVVLSARAIKFSFFVQS